LTVVNEIDSSFFDLQAEERVLLDEIDNLPVEVLRRHRLLSYNAKTAFSLDLPIGHTCTPTAICSAVCYGKRVGAPARWTHCLLMRLRTLRYLQLAPAGEVVERLEDEMDRLNRLWARMSFLRFCGTGDLVPELIPIINQFTEENRHIRAWVVTRRFDLAEQLDPRQNLYLQLSLDRSTRPDQVERARRIIRTNPRSYLSFLRTQPDDDTMGASIVFNEKGTDGLPYDRPTDCPVDAGKLDLNNERGVGGTACASCRKCFTDGVLGRQVDRLSRAA
jgi:hypothetical protein